MRVLGILSVAILLLSLGGLSISRASVRNNEITSSKHHAAMGPSVSLTSILAPGFPAFFADTGIKEIVPLSLQPKYKRWRAELLATSAGRELWSLYENNPSFLLKVVVISDRGSGAGTDDFVWDDEGRLIGATVYLGTDLDKGFPDPVYYPVMNALEIAGEMPGQSGNLLASTKLAHELGHVKFTANANGKLIQRQNKLIANYYNIFLRNGHKTSDPRLITIVNELGARPIQIWEDREYWSEVVALGYLVERLDNGTAFCSLLRKIRSNLANYAAGYGERFKQHYPADAEKFCGK